MYKFAIEGVKRAEKKEKKKKDNIIYFLFRT